MLTKIPYIYAQIRRISNNTIFALSSGYGKCGVAIIRVSGPNTINALNLLTKTTSANRRGIRPRYATLRKLWHPKTNDLIDKGIVLWFPAPNSFTGEDCCEFQLHGSPAVVAAISDALNSIDGFRPALAGEFAKRAFRSNKLDLIEIEGIADLIHAETDIQRKQALLQSDGALGQLYTAWRETLLRAVSSFEAYIDFAEDENIDAETIDHVQNDVEQLIVEMDEFLGDSRIGEMRRTGVKLAIIGEPNAGKSSFMNTICQKPISIVAAIEGTTRDIVESSFNIAGFPIILADTAGLRNKTTDPIESEGIQRAKNYASDADLIILIVDVEKFLNAQVSVGLFKRQQLIQMGITEDNAIWQKEFLIIANKCDLIEIDVDKKSYEDEIIFISCKNSAGIDVAVNKIEFALRKLTNCDATAMKQVPPNQRHRLFLEKSVQNLRQFQQCSRVDGFDFSIAAAFLRESLYQLEHISGKSIDNEEMYDFIFKQFCIGK